MSNKGIIIFVICVMVNTSLVGCVKKMNIYRKNYSENDITTVMEKRLKQKYDDSFKILSVSKGDDGVNFAAPYYKATAECERNQVSFVLRTEVDGSNLRDNYEGNLYKSEIENDINEIISKNPLLRFDECELAFLLTEVYTGSLEQYRKSGNTILQTDIYLKADTVDEATSETYDLIEAFQNKGYGYSLDIEWNNKHVVLYKVGSYNKVTEEELRRKFEG